MLLLALLLINFIGSGQINFKQAGKQSFLFQGAADHAHPPLKVWYYSPSARPDTLPMVIMLHGAERNPSAYLDQWIPTANLYQYVVVAPEFSKQDYKGSERYNLGNVYRDKTKQLNPVEDWSFSVIEPLYDFVKEKTGNWFPGYYLSGHSAGSQFVHRFLYFVPNNRAMRVMAANAGWYTLPDFTTQYPFGLKNTPVKSENIQKMFAKEIYIVLGEADTDTTGANFNNGLPYSLQGATRFERGNHYFNLCAKTAKQMNTVFNWKLITVPGVAHSNEQMAKMTGALLKMNIKNNQ